MSRLHQVVGAAAGDRLEVRDLDGNRHHVSLLAYEGPTPRPDDWLVVHTGFALCRAEPADAEAAMAQWRLVGDSTTGTNHDEESQ